MSCLHCGKTLKRRRPKSLALCKSCTACEWALFRAEHRDLDVDAWQRAFSAHYGNPANVLAALAAPSVVPVARHEEARARG